jgi:hypothetical protein
MDATAFEAKQGRSARQYVEQGGHIRLILTQQQIVKHANWIGKESMATV